MVVLKIMAMEVPYLSGLLLPAALFMGFLLAYGRLYAESEMTVLTACGMSQKRLLAISMMMALVVGIIDSFLNFSVSPKLLDYKNRLLAVAGPATLIQTVQPGRFMHTPDGNLIYYVESMSRSREKMENIFVAQHDKPAVQQAAPGGDSWNVTTAGQGYTQVDAKTGEQWLVTQNGFRYFGQPGNPQYRIVQFGQYDARIGTVMNPQKHTYAGMNTTQLWQKRNENGKAQAEWQWRISVPLSIPILTLLAIPLSRVRPREGRYAKLLPAILIYAAYANTMFVARDWVEKEHLAPYIGMWWLHALLLLTAGMLWLNRAWLFSWMSKWRRA
jgi:lipopolysaccharide export system permease protein